MGTVSSSKCCARCSIDVVPSNWVRLASGVLLCAKCFHETDGHGERTSSATRPAGATSQVLTIVPGLVVAILDDGRTVVYPRGDPTELLDVSDVPGAFYLLAYSYPDDALARLGWTREQADSLATRASTFWRAYRTSLASRPVDPPLSPQPTPADPLALPRPPKRRPKA